MEKHKHKFKNTGGGLNMMTGQSDDTYKCDCGKKFTVYSDYVGHKYLPEIIEEKEMSEIKEEEQQAINNAKIEQIIN